MGTSVASPDTGNAHYRGRRIVVDGLRINFFSVGADRTWRKLERRCDDKIGTQFGSARALPLDSSSDLYGSSDFPCRNRDFARRSPRVFGLCARSVCTLSQSEARRAISRRRIWRWFRGARQTHGHVSATFLLSVLNLQE